MLRLTIRLVLLVVSLALVGPATPVTALAVATPELSPPPPPWADCKAGGSGFHCMGSQTFNDDVGRSILSCPGFDVLISGQPRNDFKGDWNAQGQALRFQIHINGHGTLSNSVTGTSVPFKGKGNATIEFGTPGDPNTATVTLTGLNYQVTLPHQGVILLDTGKLVFLPDGTLLVNGPHQYFLALQGGPGAEQLCAALRG